MLRRILLLLVFVVAGLLFYASAQPDRFRIERSIAIAAPPERVFSFLADFRAWSAWSPWERKDPAMKRDYGAATAGPGATYGWSGNSQVGTGVMRMQEVAPPAHLTIELAFTEPMADTSTVEFDLTPTAEGGTQVVWSMYGDNNFVSKLMSVFISMDSMVGPDFEDGLARLKAAAERGSPSLP
jgi:uncharacterized protein YndB with AHSA1/START domain